MYGRLVIIYRPDFPDNVFGSYRQTGRQSKSAQFITVRESLGKILSVYFHLMCNVFDAAVISASILVAVVAAVLCEFL